ncbi:YcaO-like family protein [Candidatus Uabimicrobium helgolandensis]
MKDLEKYLVGRRCGIVQTLGKAAIDFDDPPIHAYGAKICDTAAFSAVTASKKCGGGGIEEQEAKNCCLGEAVERYCAGTWNAKDIVWATAKELQKDVFSLEELTLFSGKQYNQYNFPYLSPSSTIKIPWIEVVRHHDQKPLWAPAVFFYCQVRNIKTK